MRPEFNNKLIRIFNWEASHPGWVISLILLLSIPLFLLCLQLRIDNSLKIWYNEKDLTYSQYSDFKDHFGSDESLIVIYRNDSLFSVRQLGLNRELTQALDSIDGIGAVESLSTIKIPALRGLRLFELPLIPTRTANYERLKARIISKPIFVHNFISADGNATGIIIYPEEDSIARSKRAILADIDRVIHSDTFSANSYYLVGNIPLIEENNRISGREAGFFIFLCLLLVFILLVVYLRHILLALIPIFVALINVLWILGIYSLAREPVNMVTAIIPIIIMVVSVALSVHVITRYQKILISREKGMGSLVEALYSVFRPCWYTSLTTFVAFLAFLISDIGPVARFGMYTAMGILLSFLLSFSLLPALLSIIKIETRHKGLAFVSGWVRFSQSLANFTFRGRHGIIAGSILIILFSLAGMSRIGFESDQLQYFKKTKLIRVSNELAEQWFEGIYPVEIVINTRENIFELPEKYYEIFSVIEDSVSRFNGVVALHSPIVLFKSLFPADTGMHRGLVPSAMSGRYKEQLRNNKFLNAYITSDGRFYRISVRTSWMNNKQTLYLIEKLNNLLTTRLTDRSMTYYITGLAPMYINLNERLMRNKISSFILSFTLIFIVLIILFRNFFLAMVGMIPNIAPVITTLGIMGWLGIPLDIATILISAISLGIAVDDTIHFLTTYGQLKRTANDLKERITLTFEAVGRPITLTSALLICGFITMVFSSYVPFIYFGIFLSLNILFALLYDLLLLPALLYFMRADGY